MSPSCCSAISSPSKRLLGNSWPCRPTCLRDVRLSSPRTILARRGRRTGRLGLTRGPSPLRLPTAISLLEHPRGDIAPAKAKGECGSQCHRTHQGGIGDRDDVGGDPEL